MPRRRLPYVVNDTPYPSSDVRKIVRWAFRYMELDGAGIVVRVHYLRTRGACSGCFYHGAGRITLGVGTPERFPHEYEPYDRLDAPAPWILADWQDALVSVAGHELMHLRQHRRPKNGYHRYNETEPEWAAFRAWRTFNEERNRSHAAA